MNEAAANPPGPTDQPDPGAVMSVLAAIGKVPLVGREAERGLVEARLADAAQGPGGVIVISGEPGAGKTRLAFATAGGPGRTVVSLRCDEHLHDVPYAPFLTYGEGLEGLPQLLTSPLSPEVSMATRLDLFERVHRLLMEHAGETTCVLIIDQLEWIDAASIDLIRHLVRRSQEGGVALLATMRIGTAPVDSPLGQLLTDWNRERLLLEVPLGPLHRSDSDELVARLLGPTHPDLHEVVYARTDGLPFFIEELVRQLVTEGQARRSGGMWHRDDPDSRSSGQISFGIAANVLRRLDHLLPEGSQALRAASVLGTRCPLDLLAALVDCPQDELIEELAPAVAMRLFQLESDAASGKPTHGSFMHALVRDGLYATLDREDRRSLHGRAADLLAHAPIRWATHRPTSTDAALVAYHAERAHAWTLAYDASVAAGDAALSIFAGQDALVHFKRAREFMHAGHVTTDAVTALALDSRVVSTLRSIGRLDESAIAARDMAARASTAGDAKAEAWALIQTAGADTFTDRFPDIEAELERGREIATGIGDDSLLASALATRGILLSARGMLDAADQDFQQAIPLAEHAGNGAIALQGKTYIGLTAAWRGRYREAIARCEEATQLAEARHDAAAVADARFSLALALGGCGEYEAALDTLHHLLDLAKTSGEPFYAARVPNTIGWIYRELALVERALPWDERACVEPDSYGGICHFKARANSLINLGMDLLLLERPDEAEIVLDQADAAVNQSDYLRWRSANRLMHARGELALARGDGAGALEFATAVLAQAITNQAAKHVHEAHDLAGRALAALGQLAESVARLEQAVSIAGEIEYLAGLWRSLGHLADAQSQYGHSGSAREHLSRAGDVIHVIAERLGDPELRAEFLAAPDVASLLARSESGVRARPAYPMGLSEREVEVLRLVADGLTNAEIAGKLFISPKTVSSHLVSIYGRLGVTTRAGATRFALEHGLA